MASEKSPDLWADTCSSSPSSSDEASGSSPVINCNGKQGRPRNTDPTPVIYWSNEEESCEWPPHVLAATILFKHKWHHHGPIWITCTDIMGTVSSPRNNGTINFGG